MTGKNGTATAPEDAGKAALKLPPLVIYGRFGEKVTIAGNEYTLKVFTVSGTQATCDLINGMQSVMVDSGLPGDMLVEGSISARQIDKLQALFAHILAGAIPDDLVLAADPQELGLALNALFKMSGLTWLANVIKNYGALRTQALARAMATPAAPASAAPTGTANS